MIEIVIENSYMRFETSSLSTLPLIMKDSSLNYNNLTLILERGKT